MIPRRVSLPALLVLAATACAPQSGPGPSTDPAGSADTASPRFGALRSFSEEQIACLARTAYHEARGEGRRGMAAVIHVVLNRAESPGYPNQPCAVVRQSNGSSCQFSWVCDGRPDEPRNLVAYDRALDIARAAAGGELADPTSGAVMFHAKRVTPYWTGSAQKTAEIGSHVFYRLGE